MDFYKKRILPKYLNWIMKDEKLEKCRKEVVSGLSGIGLEIGFGSGLNLPYYQNVTKLYTLDPSKELHEIASINIKNTQFTTEHIFASAECIPLTDSSLDFVVSTWTLCSIPHPDIALKEIFRVLKPRGIFSFVEHGKSPKTLISKIQNILTPTSKLIAGGCHMNRDIEHLILSAGFEIKKLDKSSKKSKPISFMYSGTAVAKK